MPVLRDDVARPRLAGGAGLNDGIGPVAGAAATPGSGVAVVPGSLATGSAGVAVERSRAPPRGLLRRRRGGGGARAEDERGDPLRGAGGGRAGGGIGHVDDEAGGLHAAAVADAGPAVEGHERADGEEGEGAGRDEREARADGRQECPRGIHRHIVGISPART